MKTPRPAKGLTQLKLVGEITPHVNITDVRLIRVDGRVWPAWDPETVQKVQLNLTHRSKCRQEETTLFAEVHFKLSGVVAENVSKKVVSLSAVFELSYSVSREAQLTPKQLDAFARINVLYNAWPYWRELAQDVSARMGLPRLIVPVFRVGQPPVKPPAKSANPTKS